MTVHAVTITSRAAIAQLLDAGCTHAERLELTIADRPFTAIVSREPLGAPLRGNEVVLNASDYRWHISVRGPDRLPDWDEFRDIVHAVRPGVMFCVPMPPRPLWVNIDPHVLHVFELQDQALIGQWSAEGHHARRAGVGEPS